MDTFYENVDEKRKGTKMHLQSDQKCLLNETKRLYKKIEVVNALL